MNKSRVDKGKELSNEDKEASVNRAGPADHRQPHELRYVQ